MHIHYHTFSLSFLALLLPPTLPILHYKGPSSSGTPYTSPYSTRACLNLHTSIYLPHYAAALYLPGSKGLSHLTLFYTLGVFYTLGAAVKLQSSSPNPSYASRRQPTLPPTSPTSAPSCFSLSNHVRSSSGTPSYFTHYGLQNHSTFRHPLSLPSSIRRRGRGGSIYL